MNMDTYREILWLLDEVMADTPHDDKAWAPLARARYLVTDLWLQGLRRSDDVYTLTDKGKAAAR
jgi:hypothetical protein